MVKRLMADGSRRLNEMMDDPDSMLYKLIHTSKNNAEMERIIERNYIALIVVAILEILAYLFCVWNLYGGILILTSPVLLLLLALWACGVFVFSTNYEKYNFWKIKKRNVRFIILYLMLAFLSIFSRFYCQAFLPIIFMIPVNYDVTAGMIVLLARGCYLMFTAIPCYLISWKILAEVFSEVNWNKIEGFKLRKVVDMRKDKEFKYDLNIIKHMEDGRPYLIKEKDRQRHMLLSGVTGTGKTSSALVPSVAQDLDHKAHNEDYIKKQLLGRILSVGDIHPTKNMGVDDFDIKYFHADTPEGQQYIDELLKKAPSAGLTVIAPNADFADAVYNLAVSRGMKVNRVDPIPANSATGEMKQGFKGFNPLYISPTLSPRQRKLEIFRKSRMFSDVLQALYDQSGKSDPYFASLNRNLTTMLTILVLVTFSKVNEKGERQQPFATDIQEIINDFSCVRKYLLALAQIVGVDDGETNETKVDAAWLAKRKFGEYQFIVSQIAVDLLGAGRQDMEKQARGLRVIINEFLTDPLIKDVLCAPETVDIDKCLEEGQITVVNYALELGVSLATGFGLFFCLSFNQAVLRRPGNEDSRRYHFYYCDEFPVLMHRDMEQIFTLFRQYKVCFTCAFQTFSQFDRNDVTKFLKKVILSNVGHHIVYGNCAPEEMELYEQLAGKELHFVEQKTVSENAISLPDTSRSFSTRLTPTYENAVDGYKMRNKDFQEVTVFGINNGDHVDPFDGKLSFLTEEQRVGEPRCEIDWSVFVEDDRSEDAVFIKTGTAAKIEIDNIAEVLDEFERETVDDIRDARNNLKKVVDMEEKKGDGKWEGIPQDGRIPAAEDASVSGDPESEYDSEFDDIDIG